MIDGSVHLTIEFDKEGPIPPGDKVTGKVHGEVTDDCSCNEVKIRRYWKTHGRGTQNQGSETVQIVKQDEDLSQGDSFTETFSFTVPPGPYTYRGDLVNVDWYIEAVADIAWGIDSNIEKSFLVAPNGDEDRFILGDNELPKKGGGHFGKSGQTLFGAIFVVSGLVPIYLGSTKGSATMFIFGGVFLAVGLYVVYQAVRNFFAGMKVGEVQVDIERDELSPDEKVPVYINFTPEADLNVNEVTVTLRGKEWAKYRSGTDTRTAEHKFHEETIHASEFEGKTLTEGNPVTIEKDLELPEDAPFSFEAPRNRIRWLIQTHIDIPSWPDWQCETPFLFFNDTATTETQTVS